MSHLKAGLLCLLLLCFSACGRQVVEFGADDAGAVRPTIVAVRPLNEATGVELTTTVRATFSQAMDAASIDATTFVLMQAGTRIPGSVTLNAGTNTASFAPAVALMPGLVYTATVTRAAKGVSGLSLAADDSWSFTTKDDTTVTAPTVIATTPLDQAMDVSSNSALGATFSTTMDATTITALTFSLKQAGKAVAGTVTFDATANTATFTPNAPLGAALAYTATITTGVKDDKGVALAQDYVWTFTVAAILGAPPTVVSTVPADGATGVALNAAISATFSQPMDPATLNATTFTVKQGTTKVVGTVTFAAATRTVTFTPTLSLSNDLVYTATISTAVTDVAGLALVRSYEWIFTTAPTPALPTVSATSPANLALNVPINSKVTATFSEAMDPATLTTTSFTVKQGATSVAGAVTFNTATKTATFTPTAPLALGLVYTATITTAARDLAGTALAASFVWTFTTAPASAPPTVTATGPVNLGINVPINSKVTATFSEAMDPATLTSTSFTVKQGATSVAGAVTFNAAANTATFTPTAPLAFGLVYTATIAPGAKDLGGTPLAQSFTWTFTTAPNSAAPTVTATSPANLALNVPINSNVTATFSKAMDPTTLNATTFTVKQGVTPVAGAVTLNGATNTATFTPTAPLAFGLDYTASVTVGAKDLGGTALAATFTWAFTAALAVPTVTDTSPADLAINVPISSKVMATFDQPMDAATLTTTTFTLKQGLIPVVGSVTLDSATNTAAFTPTLPLALGLVYTATITTGAKDLAGTALAADFSWDFTTALAVGAPVVLSTTPTDLAMSVSINTKPSVTFSTAMDPKTITNLTFTVKQGLVAVAGVVTLNVHTNTATFTPNAALGIGLTYTATINTGAEDLAGDPLAANHTWTFSTAACSQASIALGAASGFAVLAGSTVTNTGPTVIKGDLGVSPGTAITNFPPGTIVGTLHAGDATAAQGIAALTIAYNDAAGRTLCPVSVSGNLGGKTLAPGLYKSTGSLEVSSGDLTLDGQGDGDAIFIFQMASTLGATSGRQVILVNGAKAGNIFWQVGSSATLGTTSVFQGTIMADQSITLETGATLNGRALARIAAVNLADNSIVKPTP